MKSSYAVSRDAGFSMIEVMLAMLILVFAATAIFTVFDDSWKQFKRGENAVEEQQTVRLAFDRLCLDLQMAGFNYNPDGDTSRPDEQIEAAFDTAVVIRADFDAQNATLAAIPETSLAGTFDVVSVGNDEIVTYVLAKPDGSSTDTLTFKADVTGVPRDGAVEVVNVPNVALVQDDPPYTLYRVTLGNDQSTCGSANCLDWTELAENIRSMTFRYFDQGGIQVNSVFNLTSTADDIGGDDTATDVGERASIRRIELDLVGLTRDRDMIWIDPQDTNTTTQSHRKFQLTGNITPRNMAMIGVPDVN